MNRPPIRFRALMLCCLLLIAGWRAPPVLAAGFTPEQRKEIEAIILNYLTNNPDVLLDVLQAADDQIKREAREKAAQTLGTRKRDVFDDPDSPIAGNPQGDVVLVEFFDYRCPYCKQVQPALEALVNQDRQLRLVFKEFPVLGANSVLAARAALASRKQGQYAAFHKAMMETKGQLNEAAVMKVAASVGLDTDRLKQDMASPETDRSLKSVSDLASALDIHGTPAFVIGNDIIPGAMSLDALKGLIADARKK